MSARYRTRRIGALLLAAAAAVLAPGEAQAYGGPGSVITGIGAFLAAVAAIGAAIFGFLWFPVKKLVGKLRDRTTADDEEAVPASESAAGE